MSFWTPFYRERGKAKAQPDYCDEHWERMQTIVQAMSDRINELERDGVKALSDYDLIGELGNRLDRQGRRKAAQKSKDAPS